MEIYANSIEYAYVTVEADVPLDGQVQVGFRAYGEKPDGNTTWTDAEWVGSVDTVRDFRVLLVGTNVSPVPNGAVKMTRKRSFMFFKLPESPEVIIRPCGEVTVE